MRLRQKDQRGSILLNSYCPNRKGEKVGRIGKKGDGRLHRGLDVKSKPKPIKKSPGVGETTI